MGGSTPQTCGFGKTGLRPPSSRPISLPPLSVPDRRAEVTRGVAQSGSALRSGRRGRGFESRASVREQGYLPRPGGGPCSPLGRSGAQVIPPPSLIFRLPVVWRGNKTRLSHLAVVGAWRSLVARFVRDEEAVGSNPAAPTTSLSVIPRRILPKDRAAGAVGRLFRPRLGRQPAFIDEAALRRREIAGMSRKRHFAEGPARILPRCKRSRTKGAETSESLPCRSALMDLVLLGDALVIPS
jgi:hypothetical protein